MSFTNKDTLHTYANFEPHFNLGLPENASLMEDIRARDMSKLDEYHQSLRHQDLANVPYLKYLPNAGKPNVIVSGVAEMDFPISEVYRATMHKLADLEFLGYTTGSPIEADFIRHSLAFFSETLGLKVDDLLPSKTLITNHVMGSISNIIEAFSAPGDEILIPTPSYTAFLNDVRTLKRTPVEVEMINDEGFYRHDIADFRAKLSPKTKIMILSNPQNPTGRLFTQEELEELLLFCRENNLILVSDDIHCHLIGGASEYQYIPIHNLATPADKVISLFSASKAFNVPGLKVGLALFSNGENLLDFKGRIPRHCSFSATVPSLVVIQNLFRFGGHWLQRVNELIAGNKAMAIEKIKSMRHVKVNTSHSTYLLWLDCTAFDQTLFRQRLAQEQLVLSDGRDFGVKWEGFYRMNTATSLPILQDTLNRLERAAAES